MEIKIALVIGANRGLGLQFVKTLLSREWIVWGSIRPQTEGNAADKTMIDLFKTGARILHIDYSSPETIISAQKEFGDGRLDLLINCGGMGLYPYEWEMHHSQDLMERFQVMAVGPFLATQCFLPNLLQSSLGKVANISSDMGSFEETKTGICVGYRMAKCALNMQTKALSLEFAKRGHRVALVALEPGFIPTRLTRFQGTDDIVERVKQLTDVIEKLTLKESGSFKDFDGKYLHL